MDFSITRNAPDKERVGCLVLGVYEGQRLSPAGQVVDDAGGGRLQKLLRQGNLTGKLRDTLLLLEVPGIRAQRVLLVGCGSEHKLTAAQFHRIIGAVGPALERCGARDAAVHLTDIEVEDRDVDWRLRQTVIRLREERYRFDAMKSGKKAPKPKLRSVSIAGEKGGTRALAEAVAIADGVELARDLGNLPPNVCTPSYLADQARRLARTHNGLKVNVLSEAAMTKLKMNTLLSVSRGSREPARLIVLEHNGGKKTSKPVVLVGKGVTFDSGGISIKPAATMDEMKFDMCGAASVLGVMRTVASIGLPMNVVAIIPATENLPDGNASKPGDVVTSMSGRTVEILNTDAEGRLILCDALTYAARYKPDAVIDIATLTGACVVALGSHASGLFSNHEPLSAALLAAGEQSGDRAWPMPIWSEYQEQLKSNFADVANIGGRSAGAVTAACFLARFAEDYRWAHLDIAGTAWKSGKQKGATGRPVAMLSQYLLNRVAK